MSIAHGVLAGGMKGDAQRLALPLGRSADRRARTDSPDRKPPASWPAPACARPPAPPPHTGSCRLPSRRNRPRSRGTSSPGSRRDRSRAACSAVTWPVTRSTSSHGPRCHTQWLAAWADLSTSWSAGNASLSRITRRTTKLRSVTSCASPVVHSFSTPSTSRARILSASSPAAAPAGSPAFEYGTFLAAPRTTVCVLRGAARAAAAARCKHRRRRPEPQFRIRRSSRPLLRADADPWEDCGHSHERSHDSKQLRENAAAIPATGQVANASRCILAHYRTLRLPPPAPRGRPCPRSRWRGQHLHAHRQARPASSPQGTVTPQMPARLAVTV